MGYITVAKHVVKAAGIFVSKLFRAYGLYNQKEIFMELEFTYEVSKLFRAYGLYNSRVGQG